MEAAIQDVWLRKQHGSYCVVGGYVGTAIGMLSSFPN